MHISWLGQTCVKLQTKNLDEDVTILIDAYKPEKGDFPRSFTPNIALYSHGTKNAATLSQNPFILDTIGECEIKNAGVYSFPSGKEDNLIFKVAAEGLLVVHLGKITQKIDDSMLEKIGDPDILILPVGGKDNYLTPADAAAVVNAIAAHHDEVEMQYVISPIVQACDAISGARPGARREIMQQYLQRIKDLENLAMSYTGVEKAYAIQAGRELRVIVEADKVTDGDSEKLSFEIAQKIQTEMTFPGQIKVTVIREKRTVNVAR